MAPPGKLQLYLLTFNCGRIPVEPELLARNFFDALPKAARLPDIVVVSLQEAAPIANAFLGGSYFTPYLDRVVSTVNIAQKLHDASAQKYHNLITRTLGLTALMIFVRPELKANLDAIRTAGVGVGLWNMGNKGAVGARVVLATADGGVGLTFVAAHLAPMEWNVARRNSDWEQIVRNLIFIKDAAINFPAEQQERRPLLSTLDYDEGSPDAIGLYDGSSHVFVLGDLNYRTGHVPPGAIPGSHRRFPQPTDTPDQASHFLNLLQKDQLTQERQANRTLHDFSELPITFPPTYKYTQSAGSETEPNTWHWAEHRLPSWCDRILFLPSSHIEPQLYTSLPVQVTSDHRPVALSVTLSPKPLDADNPYSSPFPLNPNPASLRSAARSREIVVGVLAYLALTREGNGIIVGMTAGAAAAWYLVSSLL